jgi:hypothetical protein
VQPAVISREKRRYLAICKPGCSFAEHAGENATHFSPRVERIGNVATWHSPSERRIVDNVPQSRTVIPPHSSAQVRSMV